ncbi:hypothetical protein [Puniceibacterium confluentis]|nr:hypothetical protein [Puniceibacterium confluentis]
MLGFFRLVSVCCALALLGGILLHDLAAAKMSAEMAEARLSIASGDSDACPACAPDGPEVVCDIDCTAPVLSTAVAAEIVAAVTLRSLRLTLPGDMGRTGLDPGSEPHPPRGTVLI